MEGCRIRGPCDPFPPPSDFLPLHDQPTELQCTRILVCFCWFHTNAQPKHHHRHQTPQPRSSKDISKSAVFFLLFKIQNSKFQLPHFARENFLNFQIQNFPPKNMQLFQTHPRHVGVSFTSLKCQKPLQEARSRLPKPPLAPPKPR